MLWRALVVVGLVSGGWISPPAPPVPLAPPAQAGRGAAADPVTGNWRGTLTSAPGVTSPIIITIAKKGDVYSGSTSGLTAAAEIPLKKLTVSGTHVVIEAVSESRLGDVALTGDLTTEGPAMKGAGTLTVGGQHFA